MADKEKIQKNISDSHAATQSSRYKYKGLTDKRSKLSSKNFNKLMQQRGLKKEDIKTLQESSTKGKSLSVRHAKAGEKVVITHGTQSASGVFVSEKSLGSTPQKRIDRGSLPVSNSAKYETKAQLDRDQNVIYGEIAPQRKFQKMDSKALPRNGGGEQVITDGGYRTGAVRNVDPKYPVPVKTDYAKKHNNSEPSVLNLTLQEHQKANRFLRQKRQKKILDLTPRNQKVGGNNNEMLTMWCILDQ